MRLDSRMAADGTTILIRARRRDLRQGCDLWKPWLVVGVTTGWKPAAGHTEKPASRVGNVSTPAAIIISFHQDRNT
jgi:hypothetical protein